MIRVVENENVFLSNYERLDRQLNAHSPPWLRRLRKGAIAQFAELGFPTTRHEEWRFTEVSPLAKIRFEPAPPPPALPPPDPPTTEQIEQTPLLTSGSQRVVFINGHYSHDLSSTEAMPNGVIVSSLAELLHTHPQLVEPHLGRHAAYRDHALVALNTAFASDGAFVHIPPGTVVEEPIHLLHISTALEGASVAHPRNLIIAEGHTDAKIVETYLGLAGNIYFTNVVTEIVLGENAIVDHYKLQREGREAFHMGTVQVHQRRDSTFSSHLVSLGGSLVRNETNAFLGAEGCQCTLNGLYIARGQQHMDSRTRIDHAKPHCHSQELYKGILDDRAEGVFSGKILVYQDAHKTDAKQVNQALLLSDHAVINTKPQLEIFADDVKCAHGATVGRLDEEALFYLRSRGISHEHARNLLVYAFASDVVSRIQVETIQRQLEQVLLAAHELPVDTAVEEAV